MHFIRHHQRQRRHETMANLKKMKSGLPGVATFKGKAQAIINAGRLKNITDGVAAAASAVRGSQQRHLGSHQGGLTTEDGAHLAHTGRAGRLELHHPSLVLEEKEDGDDDPPGGV